eukprot:TRINITY_DN6522_c0_g1_i2.p1 TRINITY_DN6522_c0_g1~~TRINITY_DN6522_c0_g1_i2.p1  ORF type:complete len:263 (-),score=60.52 TRINITY_DN6522_c0_g1_i2:711-1499(-)
MRSRSYNSLQLLDYHNTIVYPSFTIKKPWNLSNMSRNHNKVASSLTQETFQKEELEVLCINCMEMVRESQISQHSSHCSRVRTEVKLLEQCSLMQQADYKIKKLKEALGQLANTTKNYSQQLCTLTAYCEDLLMIHNTTKADILKCREIIVSLDSLLKISQNSSLLALYTERILNLAKDKYTQLLAYYREIMTSNPFDYSSSKEPENRVMQRKENLKRSLQSVMEIRTRLSLLKKEGRQTPSSDQVLKAKSGEESNSANNNE